MNKVFIVFAILTISLTASAQKATSVTFNPNSGYINTTEIQPGIGLGITNVPYSKFVIGITNISGYQINFKNSMVSKKLQGGIGTGVYIYNEGTLMPLFLDFRFIWSEKTVTPFIFASGGGLIHFNDFNEQSRIFVNSGAGARYTISESLAANVGLGILIQSGGNHRDTFLNFKLGVSIKL